MCFPTNAAFRGSVEVYAVICIVFSYRCGFRGSVEVYAVICIVFSYRCGVSWVSGGVCCNMYCVFLQMRRFVGQWSAGLRIRLNPSLQSEQIGIIKPGGIMCFVDEVTIITLNRYSARINLDVRF